MFLVSIKSKGGLFQHTPRTNMPTPNLQLISSCRSASTDLKSFNDAKVYKLFDIASLFTIFS